MQDLEELLKKPEIYENLSLFKEFLKGVKKLCDQFEEKIKMIPKQEIQEDLAIRKKIDKQMLKRKKKRDQQSQSDTPIKASKKQRQQAIDVDQLEKLNLKDGSMVEIQELNQSFEFQMNSKKQSKRINQDVKREEEDPKGIQEEDSFGGNIVQEYQ
ncbi:unnamed protein product (macronuclear) [Paramecium tetraurelia]|uniref:Uncharacterized protein n=1 Tax=Paramecium tetraurelia TaxID=5888 RepID=A0BK21_PARTE|nr:uncharacterized protein GSPATT00029518001 [Paramecium tetraurelia]CAK58888.1 unnamed protein product [Paramecium tetraurelia]|eukprot:XP_001426286.1 hypothetical protein (macronuclear) [Paramecium tetraurelia strain d4-2]